MNFSDLSVVVACVICSYLNPTLSSKIKFIVAWPVLSAPSLTRTTPRHMSKSHLSLGYAISNLRDMGLCRFFKVAQSFKNCANWSPFERMWPNLTMYFMSAIMSWNSSLTQEFNSFRPTHTMPLVVEIVLPTLWPETCISVNNFLKPGSSKACLDAICREQSHHLPLK